MRSLAWFTLLLAAYGCASHAPKQVAIPPPRAGLAGNGHQHDCVAAAERAWAVRKRNFNGNSADRNAVAMPRELDKKPAADLPAFDEEASRRRRADVEITTRIRRALLDDDSLSFSARNVKILTLDGRVTLRGIVKDSREKAAVENIANRVAGEGNVENRL